MAVSFWVLTLKSVRKQSEGVKDMKETFTDTHTALGTVQIIVGVVNIALCCFGLAALHFWFSSMSLLVGIVCVLAVKYPSSGLLIVAVILNIVSAALAITAIVLHLAMRESSDSCYYYNLNYSMRSQEDIININTCEYYNNLNKVFLGGVHIIMTVLSGLQFCVTVSFCVLTLKVMCKTDGCTKSEEMPLAVINAGEIGIVV
ncbi:uncharacterized protein [Paramisgurnus dabryanus]|uniref:uncharacterized protein n=1 Tax=Paramisgurnus dabryanus TaxID=90735 RepID=UPI0031F3DA93